MLPDFNAYYEAALSKTVVPGSVGWGEINRAKRIFRAMKTVCIL